MSLVPSPFSRPASPTAAGLVTIAAQIFAGQKTFQSAVVLSGGVSGALAATGNVSGANLSGTNTGDVSISTPNGLSLVGQALSMAVAGITQPGAVSTTTQSFSGQKTFAGGAVVQGGADANAKGPLYINGTASDLIGSALTIAADAAGGRTWSFISTGPSAGFGAGHFAFFDAQAAQYRALYRNDGLYWTRGVSGQTSVNLHETQTSGGAVMFQVSSTGVTTAASDIRNTTGQYRGNSGSSGLVTIDDVIGARLQYSGNHVTVNSTSTKVVGLFENARELITPAVTDGFTYANATLKIARTASNQGAQFQIGAGTTPTDWEFQIGVYDGAGGPMITSRAGVLWFYGNGASGHFSPITSNLTDVGASTNAWRSIWMAGTLENVTAGNGIVLAAPNGTRYRLTISNAGAVVVAAA